MFKTSMTALIALAIASQAATAQSRVIVDSAPSPEAYAAMLGIELETSPRLRTRGIQMHGSTTQHAPQPEPTQHYRPARESAMEYERTTIAAPVNFSLDSAAIPSNFVPYLDNLAVVLRAEDAQDKVLIISGHTDYRGAADYNFRLSERRADSVRTYLLERGVSTHQLISFGKGEAELLDGQESDHALNRRVEFRLAG